MSISAYVAELQSIDQEIKRVGLKLKKLKEKKKDIEGKISNYLREKDQIGLKHDGMAIILEETEVAKRKKKQEKTEDSISVLQKYGVQDPEKVLDELLNSRKGEPVLSKKLKFQKYKKV